MPSELAELWQGCVGNQDHTAATVKLHVRWELKRGQLWGPTQSQKPGRAQSGRARSRPQPLEFVWADLAGAIRSRDSMVTLEAGGGDRGVHSAEAEPQLKAAGVKLVAIPAEGPKCG